jgi:hypothetical protein
MNVPVTCRGGLHPPTHQLRLSIVGVASPLETHDWHHAKGADAIRSYEIGMFFVRNHLTLV